MRYEECVEILRGFRPRPPRSDGNEIAARVVVRKVGGEERARLEVVVRDPSAVPERQPGMHKYSFGGKSKRIETSFVRGNPPKVHEGHDTPPEPPAEGLVCGGYRVIGGGGAPGTAGWFAYVDGRMSCISNWHVLGPENGKIAVLGGAHDAVGKVSWTEAVRADNVTVNQRDIALADMNPPDVIPEMADPALPFPTDISSNVIVGDGTMYGTVGNGHVGVSYGTLVAVWSGWVLFGSAWAYFANQLQFEPMTLDGDSGSIIVRMTDGTATGLVFAGEPGVMTLASRLLDLGWKSLAPVDGIGSFQR